MSTTFPDAFIATVTWYTEDDEQQQVQSDPFGTIAQAKAWGERYCEEHDELEGLGEVRVQAAPEGVEPVEGARAPRAPQKRSPAKRGGRGTHVRKSKLSRPMSQTLIGALVAAQVDRDTSEIVVKPHDGMITKGLLNRGLISQAEAGYWRMTPEGRRVAADLLAMQEADQ